MPRAPRIDFPDAVYHVTRRGNGRAVMARQGRWVVGTPLLIGAAWTLLSLPAEGAGEKPSDAKSDAAAVELIGVRIVKQKPGLSRQIPAVTFPGQETRCRLAGYRGENAQEFYFDVELRGLRPATCVVQVACAAASVRAVWVGHTQVRWKAEGQSTVFSLVADARNPYGLHIRLQDQPELMLYYSPKPRLRASGRYRDVPWPAAAAAAEANLMFAARAVLADMQLGRAAKDPTAGFEGYVAIGGFETNYPRVGRGPGGHVDFPPHIHLFLVVPPGWRIRQASHLHLDEQGRLTGRIHCSPSACQEPEREYGPGQWCAQRDFADRLGFEFKIDDGSLVVRRPSSGEYRLHPDAGSRSFREGATIDKAGRPWCRMSAVDDPERGILRITREPCEGPASGREEETIRYDPDTAKILSRSRTR
jgi:hypothetical protein